MRDLDRLSTRLVDCAQVTRPLTLSRSAASPVPPLSQANALSVAYEASSSPNLTADTRPGRSSLKQPVGLHSLSGKRKLGSMPPPGYLPPSATNPNLASVAKPHVHFNLPPSRSIPDLRTLGVSAGVKDFTLPPKAAIDAPGTSPSTNKGKGRQQQVETMVLGDLGFDVTRAWKDAKEEEKANKNQRKIEELEREIKRLKDEVHLASFLTRRGLALTRRRSRSSPQRPKRTPLRPRLRAVVDHPSSRPHLHLHRLRRHPHRWTSSQAGASKVVRARPSPTLALPSRSVPSPHPGLKIPS